MPKARLVRIDTLLRFSSNYCCALVRFDLRVGGSFLFIGTSALLIGILLANETVEISLSKFIFKLLQNDR